MQVFLKTKAPKHLAHLQTDEFGKESIMTCPEYVIGSQFSSLR